MLFVVHAIILTDILTDAHIFTTFFRKSGFNGEKSRRRRYNENCISTRCTKKVCMGVPLNVLDLIFSKNMKNITYIGTFQYTKNSENAFFSKRAHVFNLLLIGVTQNMSHYPKKVTRHLYDMHVDHLKLFQSFLYYQFIPQI